MPRRGACCRRASSGASDSSRGSASRWCRPSSPRHTRIRDAERATIEALRRKAIVGTGDAVAARLDRTRAASGTRRTGRRHVDARPGRAPPLVRAARGCHQFALGPEHLHGAQESERFSAGRPQAVRRLRARRHQPPRIPRPRGEVCGRRLHGGRDAGEPQAQLRAGAAGAERRRAASMPNT